MNDPAQVVRQSVNVALYSTIPESLNIAFVVEYPKCGGTWLRKQIESYRGIPTLDSNNRLVRRNTVVPLHKKPGRFIKRPLILTRDPRDMLVSYFYHESNERGVDLSRLGQHELRSAFADYLEQRYSGRSFPGFTYSEFIARWSSRTDAHRLSFEDMLADPKGQLLGCLVHLGDKISEERLEFAVEQTDFTKVTAAGGTMRRRGEEDVRSFVRKGVAGDWIRHFDRRSARILMENEGNLLFVLGYEVDESWGRNL